MPAADHKTSGRSLRRASSFITRWSAQLLVALLVAPAATAGAVGMDRARGQILQLLVTDLSSAEIVLGTLAGRLLPVLGLVCCSLPVLFTAVLLGGIDPDDLLGAYAVTSGVVFLGCTLALLLSLWGTPVQEVLLVIYALWVLAFLSPLIWSYGQGAGWLPPRPVWLENADPFSTVFLPYLYPGRSWLAEQAGYLVACLALSALLALVAVFDVRRAATRRDWRMPRHSLRARHLWSLGRGPSLDANPVLWREWRRRRPSRWGAQFGSGIGSWRACSRR